MREHRAFFIQFSSTMPRFKRMDGTAQSGCAFTHEISAEEYTMEFLKELFTEALTFEAFSKACTEKGIKLADLSKGEYVAKGKLTEVTDKNKALADKVAEYETKIGELKTAAGDADALKGKIADLEKTIADRDAAEAAAAEQAALMARFDAVTTDKKFINDFTKDGIAVEFKNALSAPENKGKGDAEIFAAMIKDRDGIFVNPNAPQQIPGAGNVPPADVLDDNQVRAVMGLPHKN